MKEQQAWGGRLLVATPLVGDGIFARCVVLLLDHDAHGAAGVVLTMPGETAVGRVLPEWVGLVGAPKVIFTGGPVERDAALALGRTGSRVRLVDLDAGPVAPAPPLERVRVFAGYSGWAPGQLEAEVAEGAWLVCEALPTDAFTDSPTTLWRMVLRRQGGSASVLATLPEDPGLN